MKGIGSAAGTAAKVGAGAVKVGTTVESRQESLSCHLRQSWGSSLSLSCPRKIIMTGLLTHTLELMAECITAAANRRQV